MEIRENSMLKMHLIEKNVWGTKRFYPVCEMARSICSLIKRPTMPINAIKELSSKGWKIYVKYEGADFEKEYGN